jgi:hypothetical protein
LRRSKLSTKGSSAPGGRRRRRRKEGEEEEKQSKHISSIFKDESTGSCICLRSLIYMSHVNKVQPIRVKE